MSSGTFEDNYSTDQLANKTLTTPIDGLTNSGTGVVKRVTVNGVISSGTISYSYNSSSSDWTGSAGNWKLSPPKASGDGVLVDYNFVGPHYLVTSDTSKLTTNLTHSVTNSSTALIFIFVTHSDNTTIVYSFHKTEPTNRECETFFVLGTAENKDVSHPCLSDPISVDLSNKSIKRLRFCYQTLYDDVTSTEEIVPTNTETFNTTISFDNLTISDTVVS
jgi:hypothetical protein